MEKRLPLALFLSFLVLFGWSILNPPPQEEEGGPGTTSPAEPTNESASPAAVDPEADEAPQLPAAIGAAAEETLELRVGSPGEPGHWRAVLSNRGARLVELDFGDYYREVDLTEEERRDPANWMPMVEPVETAKGELGSLLWETAASSAALVDEPLEEALWRMERLPEGDGVRFTYSPAGGAVVFEKLIRFPAGQWHVEVTLSIENRSAGPGGQRTFLFVPAGVVPPELGDRFYPEPRACAIGYDRADRRFEIDTKRAPGTREPGELKVPLPLVAAGVHGKYFAFILREKEGEAATLTGARYRPVFEKVPSGLEPRNLILVELSLALSLPEPGTRRSWEYVVYAGPKDEENFVGDFEPHRLIKDSDLSMRFLFDFSFIGRALLVVLRVFHDLVGNWGVAIILLTICVRGALFPLNRRSQTAMARYQKKMKRVQPKLEEIKKRFANDPQKLREAQARLMQEEGAFPPLGGCLPIFFQMPIFLGLFSALRTSTDLRHQPFAFWIHDLSRPDHFLYLGWDVPVLGLEYLNLLPILMVVLWILQQRGMPQPTDEQAAKMQKMMMFMPILFGFLLYNYASGLSLYMITSSGLGIFEQKVIKKLWPIDDSEPERKGPAGCGPFSGVMQNLAEKQRQQMKRMQALQEQERQKAARQRRRRKK